MSSINICPESLLTVVNGLYTGVCLPSLCFAKETNLTQSSQYILAQAAVQPVVHLFLSCTHLQRSREGPESKLTMLQEAHASIAAHLRISAATGAINGRATMS